MHNAVARDQRAIADFDPAGEQRAARDQRRIADAAIVGDMRVLHEEIVVADDRDLALFTAAMHRHLLAEDVAIADSHGTRRAAVAEILRLVADNDARMKHVTLAELGVTQECDLSDESRPRAHTNPPLEHAEGAYLDA